MRPARTLATQGSLVRAGSGGISSPKTRGSQLARSVAGPVQSQRQPDANPSAIEVKMPPPRPSLAPPEPVPVEHSSAYLVEERRKEKAEERSAELASARAPAHDDEGFTGNAVQFLLRKGDSVLDSMEEESDDNKSVPVVIERVLGAPAARVTSNVARAGAELTASAVKEVLEIGAPVARRAAVQGLSFVGKVLQRAIAEGEAKPQAAVQKVERRADREA
ncbi:unnamed protein product [Pedinophyceae sp. YPF-701]|nr:unnamed protein product [Pedinophyceae sp. YPF-701]